MILLFACMPDDYDPNRPVDTDTDTDADADSDADSDADLDLVGTWLSTGDDLSDLFAADPFNYVRVDADFASSGSFTVTVRDVDGQTGTLTGSYAASDATNPGTVTLSQTAPYEATASGIWQVQGGVLTYEVVQTSPDYGFVPPTPASGFGTTSGPNLSPGENVQIYRRNP
jgi:hypothetical protein